MKIDGASDFQREEILFALKIDVMKCNDCILVKAKYNEHCFNILKISFQQMNSFYNET